jgi:serine/threonine-protein kinase HipA
VTREVGVWCALPDGDTVLAGSASFETRREGDPLLATVFQYSSDWIADRRAYQLCPEMPMVRGPLTFSTERLVPGALADSGPDQWGKTLLFAAERKTAAREGRAARSLHQGDFVLMARDATRLGALRYSSDGGETFESPADGAVPTLVDLPRLVESARRTVSDEPTDEDIELLTRAGTSMGGARPKVTVRSGDGILHLAKLPANDDRWDVMAWEAVVLEIARRADIPTPRSALHRVADDKSILVLERFDRDSRGRRIGYLSAHSLVEKTTTEEVDYVELVDLLGDVSADPVADRADLFRRVALTLLVNNVDDHMKNHGLLRDPDGWRLSPLFDVNPFPPAFSAGQSTQVRRAGRAAGRGVATPLANAAASGLDLPAAERSVLEVAEAVDGWLDIAAELGVDEPSESVVGRSFAGSAVDEARGLRA